MDFDHLPGYEKRFNISNPHPCIDVSQFKHELSKCQVVCSNCHRIRTVSRYDRGRHSVKLDRSASIAEEKRKKTAESIWGDRAPQIQASMAKACGELERKRRVLRFLVNEEGKRKLTKEEMYQKWDLIRELGTANP